MSDQPNEVLQAVKFEGSAAKPELWNRDAAKEIAAAEGIADLTNEHWAIVEYFHDYFAEYGAAPGLRRVSRDTGIAVETINRLFDPSPLAIAMRIAGLSTRPRI